MVSNRNLLFQDMIFRYHVGFPGCILYRYISASGNDDLRPFSGAFLRDFPLLSVHLMEKTSQFGNMRCLIVHQSLSGNGAVFGQFLGHKRCALKASMLEVGAPLFPFNHREISMYFRPFIQVITRFVTSRGPLCICWKIESTRISNQIVMQCGCHFVCHALSWHSSFFGCLGDMPK